MCFIFYFQRKTFCSLHVFNLDGNILPVLPLCKIKKYCLVNVYTKTKDVLPEDGSAKSETHRS